MVSLLKARARNRFWTVFADGELLVPDIRDACIESGSLLSFAPSANITFVPFTADLQAQGHRSDRSASSVPDARSVAMFIMLSSRSSLLHITVELVPGRPRMMRARYPHPANGTACRFQGNRPPGFRPPSKREFRDFALGGPASLGEGLGNLRPGRNTGTPIFLILREG